MLRSSPPLSKVAHAPVVGNAYPGAQRQLWVFAGSADALRRNTVVDVVALVAVANPERLKVVDSAAKAATGKLLANPALAVSAGYKEALYLGESQVCRLEVSELLGSTGLEFIRNMKQPFVRGERDTSPRVISLWMRLQRMRV